MAGFNDYIENYSPEVKMSRGIKTKLPVSFNTGVAPTAGGSAALTVGTGPSIYTGSGAPTVSATKGSLYLRTDGSGVGDRAYINTNGSTTWTAITTVA